MPKLLLYRGAGFDSQQLVQLSIELNELLKKYKINLLNLFYFWPFSAIYTNDTTNNTLKINTSVGESGYANVHIGKLLTTKISAFTATVAINFDNQNLLENSKE